MYIYIYITCEMDGKEDNAEDEVNDGCIKQTDR